jgi:autotransporter-associated beta strand protein
LQSNGTSPINFIRALASTATLNTFEWTANGGGFAAGTTPLYVKIANSTAAVNWADTEGANIAGILKLSSNTAANVVDFQSGINLNGNIRTIQVDDNPLTANDSAKISGSIADGSGPGGIIKAGPGLLTLSSPNTYTGTTTISAGNLALGTASALNAASAVSIAGSSNLILNAGSTYAFTNAVSGTGGILVKNPLADGITVTLNGNMDAFTGKITADARVRLNGLESIGNLSNIDVQVNSGGQINNAGGAAFTAKSLSLAGQGWTNATEGPAGALRLDGGATYTGPITLAADAAISSSANGFVSGDITGAYQLQILPVWTGSTQITLSGNNNYASTMVGKNGTVAAVLVAGSASAFGPAGISGPLTLDGGTVKLNGFDFSFANLTNTAQGGLIENGSATPAGITLGADGASTIYSGSIDDGSSAALSLIKAGIGSLTLSGPLSYTGNTAVNGGTLQINSAAATLTTITGTGILNIGPDAHLTATSIQVDTLNIGVTPGLAAVPEPSTLILLFGMAFTGLLLRKRMRK